jgi:hypothetical protein
MATKGEILRRMEIYRIEGGGIGSWLTESTCDTVFARLATIDSDPLSAVQLNQLLVLAHEAPVSDGFFRYFWLDIPALHPYDVNDLPGFRVTWQGAGSIRSLDHLAWGLHRLYIDGLLYFGNIRTAFRTLRDYSGQELREFFYRKRVDTDAIRRRGPALPLGSIDRDQRYLISEMACKSYGDNPAVTSDLKSALNMAYAAHNLAGGGDIKIQELLLEHLPAEFLAARASLEFSASEISTELVTSQQDIDMHYALVAAKFDEARHKALKNTEYYLSMLTDLDVYVATSMRTREHFLSMADTCDLIFSDPRLKGMNLRYFDPTLSAAKGHEDKGLIECLMVKCAKALVYCAGEKESYGKDAEAAMALSLGRPVIFFCDQRAEFYREIHPLTRLIQFETGIAVGAMVADRIEQVIELLARTFENRMVYKLERTSSGSLRLRDGVSGSVVRLQTSDKLLTETFWNHYHRDRETSRSMPEDVSYASGAFGHKPVVSGADTSAPPVRLRVVQPQLPLEDTSRLLPLAARSSSRAQQRSVAELPPNRISQASNEFPLSAAEVFDGIAKVKGNQKAGARRYAVFSEWLEAERVSLLEGTRLLRFVERTLDENSPRSGHVYSSSDLSRWYREMSNGEITGSWR